MGQGFAHVEELYEEEEEDFEDSGDSGDCGDLSWLDTTQQTWRYAADYTEEQWASLECLIDSTCSGLTEEEIDENMVCWSLERWDLFC